MATWGVEVQRTSIAISDEDLRSAKDWSHRFFCESSDLSTRTLNSGATIFGEHRSRQVHSKNFDPFRELRSLRTFLI